MGALLQLLGSGVAVAALVALVAWARIARPSAPLDDAAARALLHDEFPGDPIDALWLAADGRGVLARSGDTALAIRGAGDAYVARRLPWAAAGEAAFKDGVLSLTTGDVAAPRLDLRFESRPA